VGKGWASLDLCTLINVLLCYPGSIWPPEKFVQRVLSFGWGGIHHLHQNTLLQWPRAFVNVRRGGTGRWGRVHGSISVTTNSAVARCSCTCMAWVCGCMYRPLQRQQNLDNAHPRP
jgi:hypothetical protein